MSPEPATPDTALNVQATPTTPLRTDATAAAPLVLQQRSTDALDPSDIVAIADLQTKDYAGRYFEQVYRVPATSVRFLDSVRGLVATMISRAPCERAILLLHAAPGTLTIGPSHETITLDEFARQLQPVWGKVGRLSFDGCTLGTLPSSMFSFAEAVGITEVTGWTHTHVLGTIFRRLVTANATRLSSDVLAELARLAPWLPDGETGGSFVASTLQSELLAGSFAHSFELFYRGFDEVNFEALLAANGFDPDLHYPRGRVADELVTTMAQAQALDDPVSLPDVPSRRVVRIPSG